MILALLFYLVLRHFTSALLKEGSRSRTFTASPRKDFFLLFSQYHNKLHQKVSAPNTAEGLSHRLVVFNRFYNNIASSHIDNASHRNKFNINRKIFFFNSDVLHFI